jgi:DNA-binding XRE family transcriptional regulator
MTIFNDHQLNVAKEQLNLLEKGCHPFQVGTSGPLELTEKQEKEVQQLVESLTSAINEYESLQNGTVEPLDYADLTIQNLGVFLVECRIYKHVTQSKMAKTLGMGLIPFQNMESRFYENANLTLVKKAVSALNVDIELIPKLQPDEDE